MASLRESHGFSEGGRAANSRSESTRCRVKGLEQDKLEVMVPEVGLEPT